MARVLNPNPEWVASIDDLYEFYCITEFLHGTYLMLVSTLIDISISHYGMEAVFESWIGCMQGPLTCFEWTHLCGLQIASCFYFTSDYADDSGKSGKGTAEAPRESD